MSGVVAIGPHVDLRDDLVADLPVPSQPQLAQPSRAGPRQRVVDGRAGDGQP